MANVSTVGISVVAVAALLALAVGLLIVRGRRRRRSDRQELLARVFALNAHLASIVRELSESLGRAQEENRRSRVLGELSGSIDLEEVLARTLEAARAIPGADAALVSIQEGGDSPVVATAGLTAEDAKRQVVSGPPTGHEARAVSIAYQYPSSLEAEDLVHSGLAVPVPGEAGPTGFIAIYSRSSSHSFPGEAIRELEELAQRAGPAIANARQFREARQLADLDALTGLHNRRYFHETLAREVARAHRYDRQLALIVLDIDDFKAINDRIGHLAGDGVLAETADRVREAVRSADVACRVGGDEFAVILPESTLADADQLYRRIQAAVSARPLALVGKLHLSAGVAELRSEDDATSLFERTDAALYRAKNAGKDQIVAAG
jgi:diguanylate cyclase (GGDEF)-like protein